MKLYYWSGTEVTSPNYFYGDVIAIANSLDEALEQVKKEDVSIYIEIKKEKLEPTIYDKPTAILFDLG